MPTPVVSFEAAFVPRFEGTETGRRQIETLCAQRTLWSAIQELLSFKGLSDVATMSGSPKDSPVVEIRFIAEPDDLRSRIVISASNVPSDNDALQSLVRVLPQDYGWRSVSMGGQPFDSQPDSLPRQWQVARIERRLNFVDLPWRLLDTLDTAGAQGANVPAANTPWNTLDSQERRLITRPMTRGELELERLCLPVSGSLEIDPRSLRVLFQELRSQAPCVVSISIAAVDGARLDSYRRIAMFWGAYLQPFGAEIANAGFAHPTELRAQYDRFLLPDRFLCILTMQVAAASAVAARSVALQLTARLGGLRSFKIRDPVPGQLDMLGNPWNDVPNQALWSSARWDKRRDRFRLEASMDGILVDEIEPLFEEFLIELPHLYTIDEASIVAGLPVSDEEGLPGLDSRLVAPFSEPSRIGSFPVADSSGRVLSPPEDRIRIGVARSRDWVDASSGGVGIRGEWHTLEPRDLTKHAFIVGSTGSGKTVTTLFLVRELARLNIPFLIIEPVKTEYFDALRDVPNLNLRRVRLEGTSQGKPVPDFMAFDPMRLQEGVSVARHASYLKSCFEAAFPLDPVLSMILDAGIRGYYQDKTNFGCRLTAFSRGGPKAHRREQLPPRVGDAKSEVRHVVHPSLAGFQIYFLEAFLPTVVKVQPNQPKIAELYEQWRQIFERRFDALNSGMIGQAAGKADWLFRKDATNYNPFEGYLSGRCILELDGVPDDEHKALLMAFVMTFLFEKRQADDLRDREAGKKPSDDLRHVIVIEEAHRILANTARNGRGEAAGASAQGKSVSLFVDMLAEIRAFGQGLVIVEQIPTKIVPEAVKNTNLKIMLRLTAADDRAFLGAAMNFSDEQSRFVTSLRAESGRGVDMVVFEQQLDQPRLLTLPLPKSAGGVIHAAFFDPPVWKRR